MLLEKAAQAATTFPFRGNAVVHGIVARSDLNGYSKWARERNVGERAAMLDAFFSTVVPQIEIAGGVFFRDEGDCIVALFTDYFQRGATYDSAEAYCMAVSSRTYGTASLTAKTSVAVGDVAIFQKRHEVANGDWSAEGEPFVRAARLENAIASIKQITFYEDEYDDYFTNTKNVAAPGSRGAWSIQRDSAQVAGIGAAGGWEDLVRLEYSQG